MLSIESCRKILNANGYDRKLTDEEVKQIREFLYTLANINK